MVSFPLELAPSYFNIDKFGDYGLKIVQDEEGTEIRRYTENTGFGTRLRFRYTGMSAEEVQTLIAFYQSIKGTFGVFTLPSEINPNPNSYSSALSNLVVDDTWRFESPPVIDTVINDIYTTEFTLLSLKNEEELNINTIIGFTRELSLSFRVPRLEFLAEDSVDTLDINPLVFSANTVDIVDAAVVTGIPLIFNPTTIQVASERVIAPVNIGLLPGDVSDSGEFTEMVAATLSLGELGSTGVIPDVQESFTVNLAFQVNTATAIAPDEQESTTASLVLSSNVTTVTIPESQESITASITLGYANDYGVAPVPGEGLEPTPQLGFTVNTLDTNIVPQVPLIAPSLSYGNADDYGQSSIITYPAETAIVKFNVSEAQDEPLDIQEAVSSSLNFATDFTSIFELETRFVTHGILFGVNSVDAVLPDEANVDTLDLIYNQFLVNTAEAETELVEDPELAWSGSELFAADTGVGGTIDIVSIVPTPTVVEEAVATVESIDMKFGEFFVGFVFSQAGIGMSLQHRDSNFNAFANGVFVVNTTTAPVVSQLPTNPENDAVIIFADCTGSIVSTAATGFGQNSLTINPSPGDTIQGAPDLILDVDNMGVQLMYDAVNKNWTIIGNSF